ncbi:hypothetical protein JTB14_021083 [Gonioctena quinquepunctata]|nr:hypothetical protein JTB14_021083 [Gonioctena quinquepunctata]
MISVIRNIHEYSEGYTNPCDVTIGVLQSDPLSPLLFFSFTADIEQFFLARNARGINLDNKRKLLMLLYADDLVIFSESEDELLEEYSDQVLLQVNIDETKLVSSSRETK